MLPLASPRYCLHSPSSSRSLPPHAHYLMTHAQTTTIAITIKTLHHLLLHISNLGDGRESSIQSGSPSLALRLWPWECSQKNRTSLWSSPVYSLLLDSPSLELSTFVFSRQPRLWPLQPPSDGVVVFHSFIIISLYSLIFLCWSVDTPICDRRLLSIVFGLRDLSLVHACLHIAVPISTKHVQTCGLCADVFRYIRISRYLMYSLFLISTRILTS